MDEQTARKGLTLLRVACWAGNHQQLVRYYESAGSLQQSCLIATVSPGSF